MSDRQDRFIHVDRRGVSWEVIYVFDGCLARSARGEQRQGRDEATVRAEIDESVSRQKR